MTIFSFDITPGEIITIHGSYAVPPRYEDAVTWVEFLATSTGATDWGFRGHRYVVTMPDPNTAFLFKNAASELIEQCDGLQFP